MGSFVCGKVRVAGVPDCRSVVDWPIDEVRDAEFSNGADLGVNEFRSLDSQKTLINQSTAINGVDSTVVVPPITTKAGVVTVVAQ